MKNLEVEFKYSADTLTTEQFMVATDKQGPKKTFHISGVDLFYANKALPNEFWRHRIGDGVNQLTFKRKLDDSNSFVRIEHNIDLDQRVSKEDVGALLSTLGFTYNTFIDKFSIVAEFEWYTAAYYICYDANKVELARYMELELSEDQDWRSKELAFNELVVLEKTYKSIGAKHQNRILKSLFELYRKE